MDSRIKRRCSVLIGVLLFATTLQTNAATVTVTNTNDSGPGSLRQALADANDGDTINFDPALNGQTITLTSAEVVVDKNITISGPGADLLTVSRSSQTDFRIFHVMPRHAATIAGMSITEGRDTGGGIFNDGSALIVDSCLLADNTDYTGAGGGGIRNFGRTANLTIANSTISYNDSCSGGGFCGLGGGIFNDTGVVVITNSSISFNTLFYGSAGGIENFDGAMQISNSEIVGNFAAFTGGGIINDCERCTLTITNSTISGNHAGTNLAGTGYGGGIYNYGIATITNSTISGNDAGSKNGGRGAGVFSEGELYISNSSVSGNYAGLHGGGVQNSGSVTITNTTFSDNQAVEAGGGIYNYVSGTITIGNTVLKTGESGANIFNEGIVTSIGYNLSNDDGGSVLTGPGDQIDTDPLLGPLQDNGGPTFTHELLPGSPGIDTGDPIFTPPPFYDQRGPDFYRVRNGRVDIGLFEVQTGSTPAPTATPRATPTPRPRPTSVPR
jgi:predicted outer membrane repeat protein